MSPTARNLVCDKIAIVIPVFMHESVGIEVAVLRASLIERNYTPGVSRLVYTEGSSARDIHSI